MIIRDKRNGKEYEVLEGTLFDENVFERVESKKTERPMPKVDEIKEEKKVEVPQPEAPVETPKKKAKAVKKGKKDGKKE